MYQIVVLGLAFSLLFGGAYYIKNADGAWVLDQALTSDRTQLLTQDMVVGTYSCDVSSGCDDSRTLTLREDGEALMLTSTNLLQPLSEEGTWQLEKGQLVTVSLTKTGADTYDTPRTLLIQSVGSTTLSKVSYDATIFTDIHKPIFTRQAE